MKKFRFWHFVPLFVDFSIFKSGKVCPAGQQQPASQRAVYVNVLLFPERNLVKPEKSPFFVGDFLSEFPRIGGKKCLQVH